MESKLTIEQVRDTLAFDPATGVFRWLCVQSNRIKVGDHAGVVAANGRRYINLAGEKHLAHRLAWFHYYGVWPTGDVRQKNGDYDDCSIVNLIEQTRQETASNRRVKENSASGYAGVTWDVKRGKWQVHITRDYKQVFLGLFHDLDEAVKVRVEAQRDNVVRGLSGEQREAVAHNISRRRRQRVAWTKVRDLGCEIAWSDFESFVADVGDLPQTSMSIVRLDDTKPIGPGNWRWSLPPEKKYDFQSREGRIAYNKDHRAANPDLYREKELMKNFGITLAEYKEMEKAQNGVCAICGNPETTVRDGELLWLAVDHDHDTGKNRGLLCISCNTGIGKLNDSPALLRQAARYLESHDKRSKFDHSVAAAMAASPHRDWLPVATLGFGA